MTNQENEPPVSSIASELEAIEKDLRDLDRLLATAKLKIARGYITQIQATLSVIRTTTTPEPDSWKEA